MAIFSSSNEALMADMEIDKISERIIGSAHKVSNTLGSGFTEHVYQNALVYQTRKDGLTVFQQHRPLVKYDNVVVGEFFLDMLVNDLVIVEIKAVSTLGNEHMAQGFNYLRASGLPACLLINFGQPRIQLRRLYPSPTWKASKPQG